VALFEYVHSMRVGMTQNLQAADAYTRSARGASNPELAKAYLGIAFVLRDLTAASIPVVEAAGKIMRVLAAEEEKGQ
jgi:hypothetical protein